MKFKLWMVLALLMIASLACSLGGAAEKAAEVGEEAATKASEMATEVGEEVATQVPEEDAEEEGAAEGTTEEPTEVPTEESAKESGESGEEASLPEVDPDALDGLNSYRLRIVTQLVMEDGTTEGMTMEQEYTRDPAARRFVTSGGEEGAMEWVQIGDQSWICFDDACTQTQADVEELTAGFGESLEVEPSDFATDSNTRFVGKETVNGISTRHYVFDLDEMQALVPSQGETSEAQGDIWIADEADLPSFMVRFAITWKEARDGNEGSGEFSYEIYDVNAPITIEPPEAASELGFPDDVPIYPEAAEMFNMEGMITFSVPDDVAAVADFYRAQLADQGWNLEEDTQLGDMVSQSWSKAERVLELMISPEDDGGANIMISLQ